MKDSPAEPVDTKAMEPLHSPIPPGTTDESATLRADLSPRFKETRLESAVPQIPGFRILGKLGQGAFGAVFRAQDENLDRQVAVKLLLEGASVNATDRERFLKEARALARVRHPNVLVVHAVLESGGGSSIAIVTELIDGSTLSEVIERGGPMGAGEAAQVGVEITRALAAVHGAGIVHRDVKPTNVLRERGGRIVLADFGLGVFLADGPGKEEKGLVAGSPLFMAPEQVEGKPVSPRTDLYALGVLLYNLVTGSYPILSKKVEGLFAGISRGELRPLRDARPDLPGAFVGVVTKALALSPEDRYASAGAMEQALISALRGISPELPSATLSASSSKSPSPLSETRSFSPPRKPTRLRWAASIAALVLLLGAGGFAWKLFRDRQPFSSSQLLLATGAVERPLHDGDRLTVGSQLAFTCEPREAVHVYILNEDQMGEVHVLFPVRGGEKRNPLPPGSRHRLPGSSFNWEVSSAGGHEKILVIASSREIEALDSAVSRERLDGSYALLSREETGRVLRGIGKIARRDEEGSTANSLVEGFLRDLTVQTGAAGSAGAAGGWVSADVWVQGFSLANP